jgi:RNA polymerase sigma factor (sigma-70 family)
MRVSRGGPIGSPTTAEWLESPLLEQTAAQAARQYGLEANSLPDLVQEVRIALWEAGLDVHVGAAWVRCVARNKAVDLVRIRLRSRAHDQALAAVLARAGPNLELEHLVRAKAATLPSKLLEIFDLHYQQGFSEREIARRLGICRASVRWLDGQCRRLVTEAAAGGPARRTVIRK